MAAAAGQQAAADHLTSLAASTNNNEVEPAKNGDSKEKSPSPEIHRVPSKRKHNGSAVDLTKRPSSSADESLSSVGSEEIIPNLSDTDEDDQHLPAKRKPDEMPLDLTCV